MITNAFYGGYLLYTGIEDFSYIELYINNFSSPYFLVILYFLLIVSSFSTYFQLNKNYEYEIRMYDKKTFFNKLIFFTRKNILIVLIMQIVLFTVIFTFANGVSKFIFSEIFYAIYYMLKVYIIAILINELNLYLFEFFNKSMVILLNIFLYAGLPIGTSWLIFNKNSYQLYGYFGDYLNPYRFSNILSDISSFLLYCCIFLCIINIIIKIHELYKDGEINKIKSRIKYIFFNDISFLKKKTNLLYILAYIILSVLGYFIFEITGSIMDKDTMQNILGLNISLKNDVLSVVMFGLHFIFSIYISFYLFMNNINNGVDNIFLRIKAKDWTLCKLFCVNVIYLIIKFVIYCLLSLILFFYKVDINIFSFILLDYLYFTIIQCISLLIYILPLIWQILTLVLLVILICTFPLLNIINFNGYEIFLLIFLLIIVYIIKIVFSKLYVDVFEKSRR
jgi:hypothetical protein